MKKQVEERDDRILRASAVQKIIRTNGYRILLKEYKKVKEQAFADLRNEEFSKDSLSERQKIFNQIEEWIDLPNSIIAEGDTAIAESKEPEPQGNFIKRAVQNIGRRY